jgi:hypothetical protein
LHCKVKWGGSQTRNVRCKAKRKFIARPLQF